MNHRTPKKIVIRSRFRSTTEEEPRGRGRPPPQKKVIVPPAFAFLHQDEQDHHETGDDQDNGNPDDHRCYPSPADDIRAVDTGAADTCTSDIGTVDIGAADTSAADTSATDSSLRCQFTIPADLSELPGVEAGPADKGAVHVRLRHNRRDAAGLNGPAIQDTHTARRFGVINIGKSRPNRRR